MSDLSIRGVRPRTRRAVALGAVLAGLLVIGGGGTFVRAEAPDFQQSRVPLVGRTTTICTITPPAEGESSTTEVATVATRQAPGREGQLTVTTLGSDEPQVTITEQGKGEALTAQNGSVVVAGEGVMATAGSAATLGTATAGVDAGLMAAPCLAPGTSHWFSGVAASDDDRTELILTNADDAQAQVDLRFYGPNGRVVVPGSPGLVVEARSTRTVSLTSLVRSDGPLGLLVQSSQGRVTAIAKRSRSDGRTPIGADWQVPASSPATSVVIPGVPAGAGGRQLVVTNPTEARATVGIQVLGLQGPYAPSGAEVLELGPESTATLDLVTGLAGESGAVKLLSDQPVTGAVISTSERDSRPARPGRAVRDRATDPNRGHCTGDDSGGGQRADSEQQRGGRHPGVVRGAELRGRHPAHRQRPAGSGQHVDSAAHRAGPGVRRGPGSGWILGGRHRRTDPARWGYRRPVDHSAGLS